ncbi:MAG: hypothetical protein COB33_008935 [Thiotrichaceae bacterium]|nr:hypothetical protein [Thiotrichaceae bacterium]MBL1260638.1 hypothetical protein [Thiotrichaceae bacterium]PCI12113.1 MAG: hypothetical protein COB71_10500 [Thiotrichales bacterium]
MKENKLTGNDLAKQILSVVLILVFSGIWAGSVHAGWGYVSRANCFSVNESITWNRTNWDGDRKVLYVESWHKRRNAAASTAHRVTDGWESNSWHVRAGDNHAYLDMQVIGRHLESTPSGFIRVIRTSTDWCNAFSW